MAFKKGINPRTGLPTNVEKVEEIIEEAPEPQTKKEDFITVQIRGTDEILIIEKKEYDRLIHICL